MNFWKKLFGSNRQPVAEQPTNANPTTKGAGKSVFVIEEDEMKTVLMKGEWIDQKLSSAIQSGLSSDDLSKRGGASILSDKALNHPDRLAAIAMIAARYVDCPQAEAICYGKMAVKMPTMVSYYKSVFDLLKPASLAPDWDVPCYCVYLMKNPDLSKW